MDDVGVKAVYRTFAKSDLIFSASGELTVKQLSQDPESFHLDDTSSPLKRCFENRGFTAD